MRILTVTLVGLLILLALFTGYNHHRHTTELTALHGRLTESDSALTAYRDSGSNWIQKWTEVSDKLMQTEALLKLREREIETARAMLPRD
jgi:hypothetical protein